MEAWPSEGGLAGSTDLMISPPYDFSLIDGMVTTYFASLLPAHTTAMDAIVEQATGDDAP